MRPMLQGVYASQRFDAPYGIPFGRSSWVYLSYMQKKNCSIGYNADPLSISTSWNNESRICRYVETIAEDKWKKGQQREEKTNTKTTYTVHLLISLVMIFWKISWNPCCIWKRTHAYWPGILQIRMIWAKHSPSIGQCIVSHTHVRAL